MKAFQNDYRPIETEYSKQQREAEERKQLEAFEAEKQAEEIATRKKEFKERKKNLVQSRLEQLDQNRVDELKQQFIASFYEVENTFFAKLYEVKGFDDPVIQNKWAKFLVPVLLSEDESDFETFQKHQYAPVKV